MHNRVVTAGHRVVPVEHAVSIIEMSCRLVGDERQPHAPSTTARKIKTEIHALAGEYMYCSIGIGPNVMLAKVASDMQKPNGLTVLADADMPQVLYRLKLDDFP